MSSDRGLRARLAVGRLWHRLRGQRAAAWVRAHPLALVGVLASAIQLYAAVRVFGPLEAGTWPKLRDSVIFEYHGWHMVKGQRLYVDLWEIKPPIAFELTGLLALVSGGDIVVYHVLNLIVTSAAIVGSAVVAAAIVKELTDDVLGSVVAGVAVFAFPEYYWRALIGFKSKYFVVLCGLLVLLFVIQERWSLAGAASAALAGFWQLAVVVPLIALAAVLRTGDRTDLKLFLAGGVAVGGMMLLPVVVWGTVPAMIAEAVLTPFLIAGGGTVGGRFHSAINILGVGGAVGLLGVASYASSFRGDRIRREWPLLVAAGWFTFVVLALDLDAAPDLFAWFATVVIGIGLLVGRDRLLARRLLAGVVLAVVLVSVLTMGGYGSGSPGVPAQRAYDTSTHLTADMPLNGTEVQYVYWNEVRSPTCRLFAGRTQQQLVRTANLSEPRQPFWTAECGRLRPVWDAVLRKYG